MSKKSVYLCIEVAVQISNMLEPAGDETYERQPPPNGSFRHELSVGLQGIPATLLLR